MGLKVQEDGVKYARVEDCSSLHEIEGDIKLHGPIGRKT